MQEHTKNVTIAWIILAFVILLLITSVILIRPQGIEIPIYILLIMFPSLAPFYYMLLHWGHDIANDQITHFRLWALENTKKV